ncbi:hypothetical protein BEP19_02815 [Ammoniphilus oxalaticus]|uniref:Sigma factor regulator C-terminal domain-containing protein n=1 Tax=Ammoniphilus oxalaticus TaxID=66863 RepID=A0A419SNK6_9BACL|nr:anti-sigma factor [Ammoniphilus oxalaticus]RKD25880.1 hypothetical protein BEP19_02815 [Ammoniphilus oxalaticus]
MTEEWNEELENKILRKSRFTLTWQIVRILIIVYVLYAMYMLALNILFSRSDSGAKHAYYSNLAVEWTTPNTYAAFPTLVDYQVSKFGTQTFSYDVLKKIGDESKKIGEAQVTKRIWNDFSSIRLRTLDNARWSPYGFSLPTDPRTDKKLSGERSDQVWTTLEKLPEGTVAELSFSTMDFMSAEQLMALLEPYELKVLWLPLYTGEFENYDPQGYVGGGNSLIPNGGIGLTWGREHSADFLSGGSIGLSHEMLMENQSMMLKNMEELLEESDSYRENFLGLSQLEEKYDYLKKEGFTVYGAVVTGPTKELLKLQEADFLWGEHLGEIEWWNWYPRN